jgi:hypothetical protein
MRTPLAPYSSGLPADERRFVAVDESHLLAIQITLETHGIRHTASRNRTEEGLTKFPLYVTVAAADFERAATLVRELQVTPAVAWNSMRFRVFVIVAALVVFGAVFLALFGSHR